METPPTLIEGIRCYAPELAHHNADFPRDSFETLYRTEAGHFWFRSRQRILEFLIGKYLPGEALDFLEVGCGTGFVLTGLAKFTRLRLVGAEQYIAGLRYARERLPGVELIQLDATRLPFTGAFDAIGAFDVIEHIDDDERALRSFHQALRPAGLLFLNVPQHAWLWSQTDEVAKHKRRYSRQQLAAKVRRAGFEIVHLNSFVFLLLPAMILSRWTQRGRQTPPVAEVCELALPAPVNRFAERVMRIEERMIFSGLSLPWGGSLMAVARKA
jgi:SAM-dependent methyltransferase